MSKLLNESFIYIYIDFWDINLFAIIDSKNTDIVEKIIIGYYSRNPRIRNSNRKLIFGFSYFRFGFLNRARSEISRKFFRGKEG